jgi:ComF family protein
MTDMMTDTIMDRARTTARFIAADLTLGLKNLLLPAFCTKCSVRILDEDNLFFCGDCWSEVEFVRDPKCPRCGRPHSIRVGFDSIENFVCSECISQKAWVSNTHAAGIYSGVLRDAIHLLKFGRRRLVARPLGDLLVERVLPGIDAASYDIVTTVPLHKKRFKERGYNQSGLICERVLAGGPLLKHEALLGRVKETPAFTALRGVERRGLIKNAFRLLAGRQVKDKKILLIDDVVTTGATSNECARMLKKAGADRVDVLAVAVTKRLE